MFGTPPTPESCLSILLPQECYQRSLCVLASTLSAQGLLGKSRAALLTPHERSTCSPLPPVSKAEAKQGSKTGVSCCPVTSGPQANTIQLSPSGQAFPRRENWHLWEEGSPNWGTPGAPEQILHNKNSIPLDTDSQMLPRSEKLGCNFQIFGRHH